MSVNIGLSFVEATESASRSRTRFLQVVVIGAGLLAMAPGAATAAEATVAVDGKTLVYTAESVGPNDLTIAGGAGAAYDFTEAGDPTLAAGDGCKQVSEREASCDDASFDAVVIDLGDGADRLAAGRLSGAGLQIDGGEGNDVLSGTESGDGITGGDGNDTLRGLGGGDALIGGDDAGGDRLEGGEGDDFIDGGPGIDRALYGESRGPIEITIGDGANDIDGTGSGAEEVTDTVESITGSPNDDRVVGSCFANTLAGQDGNDVLIGDPDGCDVAGGDFMGGGLGDDTFTGGGGSDVVTYSTNTVDEPIDVTINDGADDSDGRRGVDNIGSDMEYVYGGAGNDRIDASGSKQGVSLWGRAGDDVLIGSELADFLRGEAGADTLDCAGGDNDMFVPDLDDLTVENCETLG